MKQKKKRKKGKLFRIIEYGFAYVLINLTRILPLGVVKGISILLGNLLYWCVPRRRSIALTNLRHAFAGEKSDRELELIVRRSFISLVLNYLEITKFTYLLGDPAAINAMRNTDTGLDEIFRKAKTIHDQSGGCIFVTPHIGNWEVLPSVSLAAGIPLAVVVRPLDNPYLERMLYKNRTLSGQAIIPKKNALFALQKTLLQGKSIGMLPDQSTMKGIPVMFFNREATTTPVPALLAITFRRPIVIVACCRRGGDGRFEGFVSDPLWPGDNSSEKDEVYRLTTEMNRTMESVIRMYPEQYLWMHNRWKTYAGKKALM